MPDKEGYTFLGWYQGEHLYNFNNIVTEDFVLVAKWSINEYIVTWNVDGNVTTETYKYGEIPSYKGSLTKTSDSTYNYIFVNWNNEIKKVTGNVTYEAIFDSEYIEYTITFNDEDGTEISSETYHYGDAIVVPSDPIKPATQQYTYTFAGWGEEVSETVIGNKTYTAEYTETVNEYTVTWNVDGNVTTEVYKYGDNPTYKGSLTKPSDNIYNYNFVNWNNSVEMVTKDVTYEAIFDSEYIEYTITFNDEDGTEISSEIYHYGDAIVVPSDPIKPATQQYTYTFAGWGEEVSETVIGNKTYTAEYTETVNEYTVTWNVDGNVTTEVYKYGDNPTYKGSLTKTSDNIYNYNFANWNNSVEMVTGDVIYEAVFEPVYIEYTIQFNNEDGTEISSGTYHYGDTIVVPNDPSKPATQQYTYTFAGWGEDFFETVIGSKTYTASYTSTVNTYTVTWIVDGNVTTETYEYGEIPSYKGSLTKPSNNTYNYNFANWNNSIEMVTGDVAYEAVFEPVYIEYTIQFNDEDGTEISSTIYHYGDTIVVPNDPSKPATAQYTYTFASWGEEVSETVTENKTYTAVYIATINRYAVSFYDEYGLLISKSTIKYGEKVDRPTDPEKNNYIFLGWYNGESLYNFDLPIVENISLKTKWLQKINISVEDLINESYNTIKNQVSTNKFAVSKEGNEITVSIVDTTMDSLEALEGTGIVTAAKNLLQREGVKQVTISGSKGTPVTVNLDNLFDKAEELLALFHAIAGEEGTAKDLIGEELNITIELDERYTTTDSREFKVVFTRELNTNDLINDAYLIVKENASIDKFQVYKSSNSIKINIYDRTMDSLDALEGTGVATAAKNLLQTAGVKEVIISGSKGTPVTVNLDNLFDSTDALMELFIAIVGEDGTSKDLIGETLNLTVVLEDGYYTNNYQDIIILFAEPDSFQVSFDTNGGGIITPQIVYYEQKAFVPEIPTKEGHTFSYWSSNGIEFDFNTPITEDIELTAVWNKNQYNIIFKDSDGTEISNKTYYYGETVEFPNNPSKERTELYTYTFIGWDNKLTYVKNNAIYNAVYKTTVNIDKLVNESYQTISNQAATDKFIITKENNTIITNIIDLTMDSLEALEGTGIPTAAKNLLQREGVASVTLFADNVNPVTVSLDNLLEQTEAIMELFTSVAGNENATTKELVGKAIKITINLKENYVAQEDPTFAVLFVSNIKMNEIINNSYNVVNRVMGDQDFDISHNENNIKITILNTYLNGREAISESGIIEIIKDILLIPGIESINLIKNDNSYLNIDTNNLIMMIPQIQSILYNLVLNDDSIAGTLAGKEIEFVLNSQDKYIFIGEPKITISYDAIFDVVYNVDGVLTTEKVKYNNKANEYLIPTKEGYTFSHWSLNGNEFDCNTPITDNIELEAIWNINQYTISFVTNNNLFGTLNYNQIIADYNTEIRIIDNELIIGDQVIMAIPSQTTAEYTYTFIGWEGIPNNNKVTSNLIINANFKQTLNTYTITWKVDGNVTTETYKYGDTPTYKGSLIKESDNTYNYSFESWDTPLVMVTENASYEAVYNSEYIEYTVTFNDEDGREISNKVYHYGDTIVVPSDPIKPSTAQYTYTFAGWGEEVSETATENKTYTAVYTSTINEYTVTWNVDGNITTETYEYGDTPTYKGSLIKESDNTYNYSFESWNTPLVMVTENASYEAVYNSEYIEYTVTFNDEDGTKISSTIYHYGDTIVVPDDPIKPKTAQYTYTFAGWGKEVSETVTENKTYTAVYTSTINEYTVTWNVDGNITTETYEYGDTPTYKGSLTKESDYVYNYCFENWNTPLVMVTEDITYEAIFVPAYNEYRVIFNDEDGKEISNRVYHYGDIIVVPSEPSKSNTAQYTYTFAGWGEEVSETVTENKTYTAVYKSTINEYTITWKVDGNVTTETYKYGDIPTYKGSLIKESDNTYNYSFESWDTPLVMVTENASYEAVYNSEYIEYTVTFNDEDGREISNKVYHYGDTIVVPSNPIKPSTAQYTYTFAGWGEEVSEIVTENKTYTAVYTSTINEYTITWKVDGNITTETYEYGKTPTYKGSLTKPSDNTYNYSFTGWNTPILMVTEDVTYEAIFESEYIEYTVIFNDEDGTEISNIIYHYGDTIAVPSDPIKPSTAQYTYTFAGWGEEVSEIVTENKTYTAVYTSTINTYTVTWNIEGSKTTQEIQYDNKVTKIETPYKEGHTFLHWEFNGNEFDFNTPVREDIELVAIWNVNQYTISFVSNNNSYGTINNNQIVVDYGSKINIIDNQLNINDQSIIALPTQTTAQYTYIFNNWEGLPTDSKIVEDIVITANFKQTINKYIVTWKVDGNITTETYEYGKTPTYKGSLTKTSDSTYNYSFVGWNTPILMVTKDVIYEAIFESEYIEYTVIFNNDDGIEISNNTYHYGDSIVVPSEPSKPATAQYTYTFAGWGEDFSETVTGNKTYTAIYTSTINEYTVTWNVDGNNTNETYKYGDSPTYKGSLTKPSDNIYNYSFVKWNTPLVIVTGNATYVAEFKSQYNEYTIVFNNDDGTEISNNTYHYGDSIVVPSEPSKPKTAQYTYTFAGWSEEVSSTVTGNKTYTAKYTSTVNKYTVTWNESGIITTETYEYGTIPTYKNVIAGDSNCGTYVPDTSPSITAVTGDITYTINGYNCQIDLTSILQTRLDALDKGGLYTANIDEETNDVTVTFTSSGKKKSLISFYGKALEIFEALSTHESYESVKLHTLYGNHTKPLEPDIDLLNSGFDLNNTNMLEWSDGGCNADLADWLAYLFTGEKNHATKLLSQRMQNLIGKKITVTVKLKDGYVNTDGSDTIVYELYFKG